MEKTPILKMSQHNLLPDTESLLKRLEEKTGLIEVRHLKEMLEVVTDKRNDLRARLEMESEEKMKITAMLTCPMTMSEKPAKSPKTIVVSIFLLTIVSVLSYLAAKFTNY